MLVIHGCRRDVVQALRESHINGEADHDARCWCGVDEEGVVAVPQTADEEMCVYDVLAVSQGVLRGSARLVAHVLSADGGGDGNS